MVDLKQWQGEKDLYAQLEKDFGLRFGETKSTIKYIGNVLMAEN